MWRRALMFVSVLIGAIAGVIVGLQSPRVAKHIQNHLINTVYQRWGLGLEIEHLELTVIPPTIKVHSVRAYDLTHGDPNVATFMLHQGTIALQPWPSISGALVFERVALDGLRATGEIPLSFFEETSTLPIDIRYLDILNATIHLSTRINDAAYAVDLERIDLSAYPHKDGGRTIELDIVRGEVTTPTHRIDLETRSRLRLLGSLDKPLGLQVNRALIFTRRMGFSITGYIPMPDVAPLRNTPVPPSTLPTSRNQGVHLVAKGRASLAHMRTLFDIEPEIKGDAEVVVTLSTTAIDPWHAPRLRLEAQIEKAHVAQTSLGLVHVGAILVGQQLSIETFDVEPQDMGALTGSGRMTLGGQFPMHIDARLHGVVLPKLLDKIGLDNSWVRGNISGDVRLSGELMPLRLSGDADLTVRDFASLDSGYRDTNALSILTLPLTEIRGQLDLSPSRIELIDVALDRGATRLRVEGWLPFNLIEDVDLRISGPVDFSDVGPIATLSMTGQGSAAAMLEGTYETIKVSATAEIDQFSMWDHALGNAKATLFFADQRLQFDRLTLQLGGGIVRGTGRLRFDTPTATIEAALGLRGVNVAQLLTSAGVAQATASRFDGNVQGRVLIHGPLNKPKGVANLFSKQLHFNGVAMGAANVEGGFGENKLLAWADYSLEPGTGSYKGHVSIAEAMGNQRDWELSGIFEAVPLDAMSPTLGGIDIAGKATGSFDLRGPFDSLGGSVTLTVDDLHLFGLRLGATAMSGLATAGHLPLTGTTLAGHASLQAKVNLAARLPFNLAAQYHEIEVGDAYPLPTPWAATASGTLFAQGALMDGRSISADIEVTSADVALGPYHLAPAAPLRVQYADRRFEITEWSMTGSMLSFSLAGYMPLDGPWDMRWVGRGDAAILEVLHSAVTQASGPVDVDLHIQGTDATRTYNGQASIANARIRFEGFDRDIESLGATVIFADRNISVQDGSGTLGGGTLSFGGEMIRRIESAPAIDMQLHLDHVSGKPFPSMVIEVSGNLNATGLLDDMLISGDLAVAQLQLRKHLRLNLDEWLGHRTPPLRVPHFSEEQTIALRIRAQAPGSIYFETDQVNAEFSADVMFTGTTERMGLMGQLTPIAISAQYRDIEFTLRHGTIDFTQEYRIDARYNLEFEAEGCGMHMVADLSGTSTSYTLEITGEDDNGPVPEQDPFSCVSAGIRVSEQSGASATALTGTRGTGGIGEAFGGVGDMLWEGTVGPQLRRALPIDVRLTTGRSARTGDIVPRLRAIRKIGENFAFRYDVALDEEAEHVMQLDYRLSNHAHIGGRWESFSDLPVGDLGLDLRLHWELK